MDFEKLSAPFPPTLIHWRVGSTTGDKTKGMALAYLDARDVMDRLDDVCGPEGWQDRYKHANGKTWCEIGVKVQPDLTKISADGFTNTIPGEWVWKSDGAGDTDFEGDKGAFSSAFKRAAVRWGIGRYLYDVPSIWVEIVKRGKSYAIAPHEEARLIAHAERHGLKGSAVDVGTESKADSRDPFKELSAAIKQSISLDHLTELWTSHQEQIKALPPEWQQILIEEKNAKKDELTAKEAA